MKKAIAVLMTAAVLSGAMAMTAGAKSTVSGATYTNTFDSMEDLNGWEAYYLADTANGAGVKEDFSKHWTIENGKLKRINDVNKAGELTKAAILTYTKTQYTYFELSVKYQKLEGDWPWVVVMFGQQAPGKYFTQTGIGAFVQREGMVTLWGTGSFGGPHQTDKNGTYKDNQEHTMKLRVYKQKVTVTIDDTLVQEKTFSNIGKEGEEIKGYISLMSINNFATFDDLKITALDADGNPAEDGQAEATTTARPTTTTVPEDPNVTYPAAETTLTSGQSYDMKDLAQGTVKGDPKDDPVPTSADGSDSPAGDGNILWIVLGIVGGVVVVAAVAVVLLIVLKKKKNTPTLPKE